MQKLGRISNGRWRNAWMALSMLLAAVTLGACAGGSSAEKAEDSQADQEVQVTTIEIVAHDFGFRATPDVIPAGPIETVLKNEGEQPHQALFYRLNDGVSFEDFRKKVMGDVSLIPQLAQGGVDGVSEVVGTGKETRATGDELTAGRYAILCFVRDQSLTTTKNHTELGMIAPLIVE
ncbi:MAG: hypothetical protein ACR2KQ_02580 [Actinomycetota bacterium]